MKIIYENSGLKNYMKEDHQVMDATFAVAKRMLENISRLYGIQTLDLCDTSAVLCQ